MHKIKTIFERNWDGDKTVIDQFVEGCDPLVLGLATPTEKLDGTNVRLTVRNHTLVRLEKRRNPDKIQKHKGIVDPWYVDAGYDPGDAAIREAAENTDLSDIPDGEWSGEALGPKIQGNPLGLEKHVICLFSCGKAPILEGVPTSYEELREWLPNQVSKFGTGKIEGIVWHSMDGRPIFKIKAKDFVPDNR